MGLWTCELFEKDIAKMDYRQLALWIISCRAVIQRDYYDSEERYLSDNEKFCEEWEEHYKQNVKIYQSEKYKRALVYIQCLNRTSVTFLLKDKVYEIPMLDYLSMNNVLANQKSVTQEFEHCVTDEYNAIAEIFEDKNKADYKRLLYKVVSKQLFNNLTVNTRVLLNRRVIRTATFEELLEVCENNSNFEIRNDAREKINDYNIALKDYGVAKTLFNEFTSGKICEKDFKRNFFINLSFALALTYSRAAKLLSYNGYSLNQSTRLFDVICRTAFLIGFDQCMVISLIEKKNREIEASKDSIFKIPKLF